MALKTSKLVASVWSEGSLVGLFPLTLHFGKLIAVGVRDGQTWQSGDALKFLKTWLTHLQVEPILSWSNSSFPLHFFPATSCTFSYAQRILFPKHPWLLHASVTSHVLFPLPNLPYLSCPRRPFIIQHLALKSPFFQVCLFPTRKHWSFLFLWLYNTLYCHIL